MHTALPCIARRFVAVVVAAVALMAAPHPARSQGDPDAVAAVTEINRKALDDYDNLNFDEARNGLKEGLALCERRGLGSHPIRAQTYLNLGIVLLAADAQHREIAVAHFRRALEIQPDIRLPERIANPEVQVAFAEARTTLEAAAPRGRPGAKQAARGTTEPTAAGEATVVAGSGEVDAADGEAEIVARSGAARERSDWFLAFGIGSGMGLTSGNGEVNTAVKAPSGFQPSSVVHLSPEIGYFVRRNLLLSLQGRFQLISGATPERDPNPVSSCGADHVCSGSTGATAVFAKATWFFGEGALHPYVSGALGFGRIRHVVSLPNLSDCGADAAHPVACVDTAAAGPVFIGPGAGVAFDLSRHLSLTLGASTLLGFSAFTFHVDVNAGVAVTL